MKRRLVIAAVALLAALTGCEKAAAPAKQSAEAEPAQLQCGCCLSYRGARPIPDEFWKACDKVFALDTERIKVQAQSRQAAGAPPVSPTK
jgi:hypothetical protein